MYPVLLRKKQMESKIPIVLIGGGGHSKACIDIIEQNGKYFIAGMIDHTLPKESTVLNYPIIGNDEDLPEITKSYTHFLIAIGQIKSSKPRENIVNQLSKYENILFPTVISPHAYVSPHAQLGSGTIVMHGATINAASKIGNHCIINTQANIEHDVSIDDFCHISTGAMINGEVAIGKGSFIGSKSVIKEQVEIGSHCIIGAGTSVRKDIPNEKVVT